MLDAGGKGLFTGTDPVADRVILTGDELFGATLADLSFYRGFNNNGQVAFVYQLSDSRTGIAIATPVPEPGTFMLLAGGALCSIVWKWRRK